MKVAHLSEPAEERVVFRDGLGVRERRETGTGEVVEWLHLDPAFAAAEVPLRDRVTRLAKFQHVKFARIFSLEPARKDRGPILLSSHIAGARLAEVLEMAGHGLVPFEPGVGLQVTREVLGGLSVLHDSRNLAHGALGPERVVLTATGRVVIVEHVLGQALDRLQRPRHQLWREWRIPTPPAAGGVRMDMQTDLAQAGMLALAVLLGRPVEEEEYPHRLRGLLPIAQDRLARSAAAGVAAEVVAWLERLVPVESRRAFKTVREAQHAFEGLVSGTASAMGVSSARVKAVMAAVSAMAAVPATSEPAAPTAPTPSADTAPAIAWTSPAGPATDPEQAPVPEDDIDIEALLRLEAELEADDEPGGGTLDAIARERVDLERQFADIVAAVAPVDDGPVHLIPETPATSEPLVDARVLWSSMPADPDCDPVAAVDATAADATAVDATAADAIAADAIAADAIAADAIAADAVAEQSSPVDVTPTRDDSPPLSRESVGDGVPLEPRVEGSVADPVTVGSPLAVEWSDHWQPNAVSDTTREDAGHAGPVAPVMEPLVVVPLDPPPAAAIDYVPAAWWREALPWRADGPAGDTAESDPVEDVSSAEASGFDQTVPVEPLLLEVPTDEAPPVAGTVALGSGEALSDAIGPAETLGTPEAIEPGGAHRHFGELDAVGLPEVADEDAALGRESFGLPPEHETPMTAAVSLLGLDARAEPSAGWRDALLGADPADGPGDGGVEHFAHTAPEVDWAADIAVDAAEPCFDAVPDDLTGIVDEIGGEAQVDTPSQSVGQTALELLTASAPDPVIEAAADVSADSPEEAFAEPVAEPVVEAVAERVAEAVPESAHADDAVVEACVESDLSLEYEVEALAGAAGALREVVAPVVSASADVADSEACVEVEPMTPDPAAAATVEFSVIEPPADLVVEPSPEATAEPAAEPPFEVIHGPARPGAEAVTAAADVICESDEVIAEVVAEAAPGVAPLASASVGGVGTEADVSAEFEPMAPEPVADAGCVAEAGVFADPVAAESALAFESFIAALDLGPATGPDVLAGAANPWVDDVAPFAFAEPAPLDADRMADVETAATVPAMEAAVASFGEPTCVEDALVESAVEVLAPPLPVSEAQVEQLSVESTAEAIDDARVAEAEVRDESTALAPVSSDDSADGDAAAIHETDADAAPHVDQDAADVAFAPSSADAYVLLVGEPVSEAVIGAISEAVDEQPAADAPLFGDLGPILLRGALGDDAPVDGYADSRLPVDEAPMTAAASLLAYDSGVESTADWRDTFLDAAPSTVDPSPEPFSAPLAETAHVAEALVEPPSVDVVLDGDRQDSEPDLVMPEASTEPDTCPVEEVVAEEPVGVDAAPDGHAASPDVADGAAPPESADGRSMAPAVVIVDDGPHGDALDQLTSEETSAPLAAVEASTPAGSKKRRKRTRRKKTAGPDAPPPAATPVAPSAPPSAAPAVAAPPMAEPPTASPMVSMEAQGLRGAPEESASLMPPRVSLSAPTGDDDTPSGVAARGTSLLNREVPVWKPPAGLFGRMATPAAADAPAADAPLVHAADADTAAPVEDRPPLSVASTLPVVRPVAPVATTPVTVSAPDVYPPFEEEIKAVGMPDLEDLGRQAGRSGVTPLSDGLGTSSGPPSRVVPLETRAAVPVADMGRGTKWRRLAAAAVIIALLQGVGFAAWWWAQPGEAGTLVVQTSRTGVEVLLDDKVVGQTPFREAVAPGRHKLGLRLGSTVREMPVEISLGVVTTQSIDWPSPSGGRGSLQVTSNPPGAQVFIDGKSRGSAPLLLEGLAAGDQQLELRSDAGSVTVKATVVADQTTPLEVKIFAGWILVDAPVEVNLLLNGRQKIGSSMDGQILLQPGPHRIQAVNEALGIRQWFSVTVEPGAVRRVPFTVPPGTLTLQEEAEVFVDGSLAGTTPGTIRIAPGTRDIAVRPADGPERRQALTVRSGQRIEF